MSGERIEIRGTIDNPSNKAIDKLQISLLQKLTFTAEKNKKVVKRILVTLIQPNKIPAKSKDELNRIFLKVPPTNPTSMKLSKIIDVSYALKLTFDIEGPSIDSVLFIPVTIGNLQTFFFV